MAEARGTKRDRSDSNVEGDEFSHLFGGAASAAAATSADASAQIQAFVDSAEHTEVLLEARERQRYHTYPLYL